MRFGGKIPIITAYINTIKNARDKIRTYFCLLVLSFCVPTDTISLDTANLFYFSETAFFLEGTPSTCCGTLSNVEFYAKATGTLLAQVWRSGSAANKYELIAEETITGTELAFTKKACITKTRLFKYTGNLSPKTENFQVKKKNRYFSYFCTKHRLWVLVRTASPRRF